MTADTQIISEIANRPESTPDALRGDPTKNRSKIMAVEATTEVEDFADAIKHTRPADIELRSPVVDRTEDGTPVREPSWTSNESEARLIELEGEWVYTDGMLRLDALQVVALEESLISDPTDYPVGSEFSTAIKALRRRGAAIPKYDYYTPEHVPVLPPEEVWKDAEERNTAASRSVGVDTDIATGSELTMQGARDRTRAEIVKAIQQRDPSLVIALPTLGKSYGTILATAETGEPITILTCRGHKEQYEQFEEWCDELGLYSRRLPSFFRLCPSAPDGSPETDIEERIIDLYRRGAKPTAMHERSEEIFGHSLSCQQHGDCPYMAAWDFDPDQYDVFLGYYTHFYNPRAVIGRTVVIDEFPGGSFETKLKHGFSETVTQFLSSTPAIPYDDYADLLEHRDDRERRETALEWFEDFDGSYVDTVFEDERAHASAPLAAYTLLSANDFGNGWEQAWPVGEDARSFDRVGLFNREKGAVNLLRPPDVTKARNVIALDGTPTPWMWEKVLAIELTERRVLSDDERRTYIRDVLQHDYIRTTEYPKPYNRSVNAQQDAVLLSSIRQQYDEDVDLITTKTAENRYQKKGLLDIVDTYGHYGNVLGSNEFDDTRVGVVIGSNHYGDDFVKRWSAYLGAAAEREGEETDLTYGPIGDKVYHHMVAHETLQAVMRSVYPDVSVETKMSGDVTVLADSLLSDVLGNILKNAVEHNDLDDLSLSVSVERNAEVATIRIADTGSGIPDNQKEAIFRRGETGHVKSTDSGFGLFFVDSMIEEYGGTVWVEDNEPAGAVFVIELPIAEEQ